LPEQKSLLTTNTVDNFQVKQEMDNGIP
jgi:hypothetical protein